MSEQQQQPQKQQQDPQLKLIENHIKGLLFNQTSPTESTQPPPIAPDLNYNMNSYRFPKKPFSPGSENAHLDTPLSSLPLDCSLIKQPTNSSSQLIDLNVLTNFAAKHADINDISNTPRVLPHPELEDDSPITTGTNITKDILSNFNTSHEFKSPSAITSIFENLKSAEKNMRQEHPNGTDQIALDKKKKKKSRRPNKEKSNRKMQGNFEPINQSVVLLKPEAPKQDKVISNKHYAPQKGASKSPEKKKDIPRRRFNHLPTVPLPAEEIEFTLTLTKDGYKFVCNICNYEAKSKDYIHKHINSENHKDRRKQIKLDRELAFLPKPLPAQIEAIDQLLSDYHAEYGLKEEDLILRRTVESRLIKLVETKLTDCSIEMIGSSVTGLGLKSSKVDFALKVEEEKKIPDCLELLYNTLLTDPAYCDVESVFKKKRLGILFTDKETGLGCTLVLENSVTEKFSKLFFMYSELDPRLKVLASCFRYWAKICLLDNQDCGTLPPYTYSILLVFFLQQTELPVLPVLQEVPTYGSNNFMESYVKANVWKSENTCSVGELWIQLFYYYNFIYEMGKQVVCIRTSERVMCVDRNWSTKFYAIEDPFSRRNIAHVIPNFSVAQFIQQCFMKTYRHFAFPRTEDGEIQLLKNHEFDNLLQSYLCSKSEAMEDLLMDDSMTSDNEDSSIPDPDESGFLQDFEDQDPDIPIEDVLLAVKQMSLDENKDTIDGEVLEDLQDEANTSSSQLSPEKMDSPKKEAAKKNKERTSLKMEERRIIQSACSWDLNNHHDLSVESFVYKMDPLLFKDKKEVPSSCKNCKGSGHLTKNCPNDYLPPRQELPPMTEEYHRVINKILLYIRDKHRVEEFDKDQMYKAMKDIEAHIQKLFSKANLSMFGSFCNGFGFKSRSDMDFCLTFKDHDDRKDLDCTDVIQKLAKHLRDYPKLENIVPVTSAKVPIVKFACKESGLEGDISLYNTLAIANTEMLEMYSRLDPRVQILGFALKYFAKVLGICDASRGSLSSYAYILMVIFFLQQRDPPVIPVLQELHGEKKPYQMIEDWNVWYFKDFDKVPEIWPGYGKNTETAAELWLGLLSFYAYDFDWQEYVISIRQKALLTRFRKLWITNQIAIEDPFDLNHNLGAGLSQKMNMYIFRTFVRARERFGVPLDPNELAGLSGHEVKFLFDRRFLNSGSEPPHDRGCRKCGKIGHVAKNCPQEKLCSFCKKPGHLQKSCPKRKPQMKSKNSERNIQEPFPKESKNIEAQNLPNHVLWPHTGDMQRANQQLHPLLKNSDGDLTRSFLQMGYPTHRHPPPGFPKASLMGPPPGFHQNSTKYRFSSNYPAPFPRTSLSQSPPKHYSCSPPKNFMGVNMYHPESFPSIGIRQELRNPHSDSMPHRMWGNQLPTRMPQPYTDRRKRTN